jgi:hypothetical protein
MANTPILYRLFETVLSFVARAHNSAMNNAIAQASFDFTASPISALG